MGCGTSFLHHRAARKRATDLTKAGFKSCVQNGTACACASKPIDLQETTDDAKKGIICSRNGTDPVSPREVRGCTRFRSHSSG